MPSQRRTSPVRQTAGMEVLITAHDDGQVDFKAASEGTQFVRIDIGDADCMRVLLTTLPRERRGELIEQAVDMEQRIVAPGRESRTQNDEDSSGNSVH